MPNQKGCARNLLQKIFFFSCQNSLHSLSNCRNLSHVFIQRRAYVDVYMDWKKDTYFESIESIHRSIELKPIIALKNCIVSASPQDYCIPISAVSKRGLELGIPFKVARFLRKYPSFFEEFEGPKYNLPWFKLTPTAIQLDKEEREVYEEHKNDIVDRLKKLILMSVGEQKVLPLKVIQGLQWYLGLPDEFLRHPESNLDGHFRIVEMGDELKGLAVGSDGNDGAMMSILQQNAMKKGVYAGGEREAIVFPLFPSKGLRLKRKISDWMNEFQRLPYVSPYEDSSDLKMDSDLSEKRVVGILHELLGLFVEHAAERKRLLCLRKCLGLPQKVHKAFERHPHMFYLSLRNKTCTVILKEAYREKSAIEAHPIANVRKKYINLMKESEIILKSRRVNNRATKNEANVNMKDLDCMDDDMTECCLRWNWHYCTQNVVATFTFNSPHEFFLGSCRT
ncbi:protein WHAT'S THIS FACTOR 9, mitochondrial-like isoform X3 [Coffea arabica]|uniref:Protein WHAT'S THIS FACTOR 9, mitochondrial-like isoform X3 n=1 Tax=Coffea arabica TaxID=13443 RepID=A0A6P6VCG0_COFAR|nr:protein WHAT'S THIS FACTOR 9, mitochondrial-like isoform X2 [Coffea arabica]